MIVLYTRDKCYSHSVRHLSNETLERLHNSVINRRSQQLFRYTLTRKNINDSNLTQRRHAWPIAKGSVMSKNIKIKNKRMGSIKP